MSEGQQWLDDRTAELQRAIRTRLQSGKQVLRGGIWYFNKAIMIQMTGDELCFWIADRLAIPIEAVDVVLKLDAEPDGGIRVTPDINVAMHSAMLRDKAVKPENEHEIRMMLQSMVKGVIDRGTEIFLETLEVRSRFFEVDTRQNLVELP